MLLSEQELSNWTAIYAGMALCCMMAGVLTTVVWACQLVRRREWSGVRSPLSALTLVVRTWWRWQLLYLSAAPATLAIIGGFAWTLNWR